MSVYIFEMGLNVPTDLGQVCCWAQTAWLLEQTRVCTSLSFWTLGYNSRFKEGYVVGSSGRLYLPCASASGERKRATHSQKFRIKGDCALQNLERAKKPRGCVPRWTLSLYSSKVAGLPCLLFERKSLEFVDFPSACKGLGLPLCPLPPFCCPEEVSLPEKESQCILHQLENKSSASLMYVLKKGEGGGFGGEQKSKRVLIVKNANHLVLKF